MGPIETPTSINSLNLLHKLLSGFNMKKMAIYLAELRAPFFTGSIIPVLFGTTLAWYHEGEFSLYFFILNLIGAVMIQAGANVANDYYDHISGNDVANTEFARPFTGGSRMIQRGLLTPREVLAEACLCYAIGALIGLWLAYTCGWFILALGLFGGITSYFYSAPPFKLVHRGIGEIIIGLDFGILMVAGTYFVQTGKISLVPVIASLPLTLLIIAILYINEFQDYNADRLVGKFNWVVRLGRKNGAKGYLALIAATYLSIVWGIAAGALPIASILTILTLPLAVKAVRTALANYENTAQLAPANAATILLHLLTGSILAVCCLLP